MAMMVLALAIAAPITAQDIIRFERHFPGGIPEQFEVELRQDGLARYSEGDHEPVDLDVGREAAGEVFALAASLDYFSKPLASKRKVASTGRKTLHYESGGGRRATVEFDYSDSTDARELVSWFVKLASTYQHLVTLERTFRFDRLGVNAALAALEASVLRERVVALELLEPVLVKITQQPKIVHLARARAEGLLERIRSNE